MLYNFVRNPPPGVYVNFGEGISCVLSEMSFEAFTPVWPHVNENNNNNNTLPKFGTSQFFKQLR